MKRNILTLAFFALSFLVLILGKDLFAVYLAIISLVSFYEIVKVYKKKKSVPLFIEILNYLVLIFITILYSKALDYRLLAATFFVNLIPIIFHVKDYDFYDAMFLICSNLFVGGAFGSLLYIRNESIYEVFYLLLLVLISKVFYFLGDHYIGKHYNKLGKSYEGMIVAILMSAFVSSVFYLSFINLFNSDIYIVIMSFILAVFSSVGELVFIYVKNELYGKKTSNKTHSSGTIFNRANSILFVTLAYMIIKSIL